MSAPIVAVEMGTSKIVVLVGEIREDGRIAIIGVGESSSAGIRKGEIVNLENASACLRTALAQAEESANISLHSVYLSIAGGHIKSIINAGTSVVLDPDGWITVDDIDEVVKVVQAINLSHDQKIIHTLSQYFTVGGQHRVINPEGMEGAALSLEMMILHGNKTCINNTVNAVQDRNINIDDVVFSGICSALAVITEEQKSSGVVVIDIGGGTTDYIAYNDNIVVAAGSLAVGGDHITNDIVLAFNIPMVRAEEVKKKHGSAIISTYDVDKTISLGPQVGFAGKTFSHHALSTVINARVDEILKIVFRRLDEDGIMDHIGAGIILTGGCARLDGIMVLAHDIFGIPATVGKPNIAGGISSSIEGPEYATCYGLVNYGAKTELSRNAGGFFKRFVNRILGQ
jgi:cell division protein FtsA